VYYIIQFFLIQKYINKLFKILFIYENDQLLGTDRLLG